MKNKTGTHRNAFPVAKNASYCTNPLFSWRMIIFSAVLLIQAGIAYCADNDDSNEKLLNQFVQTKQKGVIVFDPANIKQFWISNSVVSTGKSFQIELKENAKKTFESSPLPIQLMNVDETQDCKIEIISSSPDFDFSVLGTGAKVISKSSVDDPFVHYSIISSTFHLEDTSNLTFSIRFESQNASAVSIKRIILSFSQNKSSSFLPSPGTLDITRNNVTITPKQNVEEGSEVFSATGKQSRIFSTNKILVSDKPLTMTVTVKNVGKTEARFYSGYGVYSKAGIKLDASHYPYMGNQALTIVSSDGSEKLVVDSYPEWKKDCTIALKAKDDLSDLPNTNLAIGKIVDVKKTDDGQAEIVLDKPVSLSKGEKVRVQGPAGGFLYLKTIPLKPNETQTITTTIQKDDSILQSSSKGLSHSVYYVVPIVMSYSVDPAKDNTIEISNYSVSF